MWHRDRVTSTRWLVTLAAAGCGFSARAVPDAASFDANVTRDTPRQTDGPPPMVTFVSSTSGAVMPWNTGVIAYSMTLASNPGAGNLLAVYVTFDGRVNLSSITDSAGNAYTIVQAINDSSNQQKAVMAYARVAATGPDTIMASFDSGGCCNAMIVHELHGANAATPLDTHAGQVQANAGTATDGVTTGAATSQGQYNYVFAATSNSTNTGGLVISAGTGQTLREKLVPPGGNPTSSEDRIVAAPGAVASTFTFSKNGAALTLEMAFRP
jgi:hypothetical protein